MIEVPLTSVSGSLSDERRTLGGDVRQDYENQIRNGKSPANQSRVPARSDRNGGRVRGLVRPPVSGPMLL
jgi:hypothetical protein